ncbi:MAG TPA: MraY family glycosyltransferase [Terriglobales bacterium]|nr:MraY family glycosyltransferase [Terriglobales bacterium]
MTFLYLVVFGLSVVLSFIFTRSVRNLALSRGWVSAPSLERHLHRDPLPRLGGVAIFTSFAVSLAIAQLIVWRHPEWPFPASAKALGTLLPPACIVFLLGIYDDVRGAGPYLKFTVQALAGTMLFAGGLRILDLPVLFGTHDLPWFLGLPLTILWVLAITNAFNLIDGLDGLAAGSALFSTIVVFVVALLSGSSLVALLAIALAGSVLGFLRFNFNPATIFLGDGGSLFIGFMLSALALQGAQKAPTIIAVAIPVVSFGLPILETALSVMRRFISGRPVFTADREHIHHKLLQLGLSHRQVVIVLYAVSALFALLSLFLLWPTGSTLGLVLAVVGTGVWLGVQHLGYLEFGELRRVAQRTIEQRQIVINNLSIRRATEELKVARDYDQICNILTAAFGSNDFDWFELSIHVLPGERFDAGLVHVLPDNHLRFAWTKPGASARRQVVPAWTVSLELVTTTNQRRGSMSICRFYTQRNLQLDVNLLTSVFPCALADALDRVFSQAPTFVPSTQDRFIAARV